MGSIERILVTNDVTIDWTIAFLLVVGSPSEIIPPARNPTGKADFLITYFTQNYHMNKTKKELISSIPEYQKTFQEKAS